MPGERQWQGQRGRVSFSAWDPSHPHRLAMGTHQPGPAWPLKALLPGWLVGGQWRGGVVVGVGVGEEVRSSLES